MRGEVYGDNIFHYKISQQITRPTTLSSHDGDTKIEVSAGRPFGFLVCDFVERTLVRYGQHEINGVVSSGLKSALQWLVMCMVEFLDWQLCVVN